MKSRAAKPTAEERTIPLPKVPPGTVLHCPACEEDSPIEKCRSEPGRADVECPECGCSIDVVKDVAFVKTATSTRVDPKPKTTADLAAEMDAKKKPEPKPMWCGACATEMTWAMSTYFYACGHNKDNAGMIDDPRHAKAIKPAAPHKTRTDAAIKERDVDRPAFDPSNVAAGPVVEVKGNRMSIAWGKARCPVDRFNAFDVGGHIVTVDLAPNEDRVEVATKILDDLEQIAELSFQRQHKWYLRKLGLLDPQD